MQARKNYDITPLGIIIGRNKGRVIIHLNQWMSKLGKMGFYLSVLDMDLTMDFMTREECEKEGIPQHDTHSDNFKNFFDACIPHELVDMRLVLIFWMENISWQILQD